MQQNPTKWLSIEPQHISLSLAQIPGRISECGRMLADALQAKKLADHEFEKTSAMLFLQARAALESAGTKPTEKAIDACMRTDERFSTRYDAAYFALVEAEASYERAKVEFMAIREEANTVVEAARSARAEMGNLNPSVGQGRGLTNIPGGQVQLTMQDNLGAFGSDDGLAKSGIY
jgi:hypothetical protein